MGHVVSVTPGNFVRVSQLLDEMGAPWRQHDVDDASGVEIGDDAWAALDDGDRELVADVAAGRLDQGVVLDESDKSQGAGPGDPGDQTSQSATGAASDVPDGAPPLGGPGSGRDAWADYAGQHGVTVTDDMTRDDIVAAVNKED